MLEGKTKCDFNCLNCPFPDCVNDDDRSPEESKILKDISIADGYKSTKKKRENQKKYYQEHREKYLEYLKKYREKNREKLNKYRNDFYYAHHEYEVERQRRYDERKKGL